MVKTYGEQKSYISLQQWNFFPVNFEMLASFSLTYFFP